jgi:iron complex transport system substrate-binding protein
MIRLSGLMIGILALLSFASVGAQAVNLTEGCVSTYDPAVDYFPEKLTVDYATGFQVEYAGHYKVVTVTAPWFGATEADGFQYVLVQCGTPAPEGFADAQVIEVPVQSIITMSTSYLPHLVDLGLVDRLIGLDSLLFANAPEVRAKIEAGELIEIGSGATVNVEAVIDAEPGIVMTYGSGIPEYDTHPVLLQAGIPVAVASDFVERDPLGAAEWMKFTALFFNAEAEAQAIFSERAQAYESLAALTADLDEQPVVLWSSAYQGTWFLPGTETFIGQLISDAGASLALADDPLLADKTDSVPFDFEVVFDGGAEADFWFPGAFGVATLDDLLAQDERYAQFAPVQNNQVYNNDAIVNANGGNDYFESGASRPDVILADLIHILHPDLLPDHELVYYRHLVNP